MGTVYDIKETIALLQQWGEMHRGAAGGGSRGKALRRYPSPSSREVTARAALSMAENLLFLLSETSVIDPNFEEAEFYKFVDEHPNAA